MCIRDSRSTKDRTAAALVKAGIADGTLSAGVSVIESSSGNLGMALARECLLHGWPFHCVVDPRANPRALALSLIHIYRIVAN